MGWGSSVGILRDLSDLLVSLVDEAAPSTPKNPPQNSFGNGIRPGELDPCCVNPTTPSALVIGMLIRIPWGGQVPKVNCD